MLNVCLALSSDWLFLVFWVFWLLLLLLLFGFFFAVGLFLFCFAYFNPQEEFKCSLGFFQNNLKLLLSNIGFTENYMWEIEEGFSANTSQVTSNWSWRSYFYEDFFLLLSPLVYSFYLLKTIKMLSKINGHVVSKTFLIRNGQLYNCTGFLLFYIITVTLRWTVINSSEWLLHSTRYKGLEILDSWQLNFPTLDIRKFSVPFLQVCNWLSVGI